MRYAVLLEPTSESGLEGVYYAHIPALGLTTHGLGVHEVLAVVRKSVGPSNSTSAKPAYAAGALRGIRMNWRSQRLPPQGPPRPLICYRDSPQILRPSTAVWPWLSRSSSQASSACGWILAKRLRE